jgi:hypothetical protein
MANDLDTFRTRLDRLGELAKLAGQVPMEDRARAEGKAVLASLARHAVVQAQQEGKRAALLTGRAETRSIRRRTMQSTLLTELHIMDEETRQLAELQIMPAASCR